MVRFYRQRTNDLHRDAYVKMKAKEKGIPEGDINRGGQSKSRPEGKFNAFREMEKAKHGQLPSLAKIPDGVAIVGSRPEVKNLKAGENKKRSREDDVEEREGKEARTDEPEPLVIEYNGASLECDRHTGKVLDRSKVAFEINSAVKFINHGENPDWKDLKVRKLHEKRIRADASSTGPS